MEQLSSFVLASILLTLTPGPDLLMVIAKSLEKGVTTALYFIAGLMTGLSAHTLLLILGWPQLIGERPAIVMGLKLMGGVYFSYLGIRSIYQYFTAPVKMSFEYNASSNYYRHGVLMNLLNPKVSLFFWLFFPGFLFSESWTLSAQYTVLGSLFLLQAAMIFSLVAIFSVQFKDFFSRFRLGLISGLLWIILGIYLVLT
ncbi:MAG: LysE family translocator [Flavobacteriaceae bacterium]|nr:LysE family translocator [Flavobacteriaceae bacterium]